jgi:hypothetical protein
MTTSTSSLKFLKSTLFFLLLMSTHAAAFVLHDLSWFQTQLRIGFDIGSKPIARIDFDFNRSLKNTNAFCGVTIGVGFYGDADLSWDLAFNTGYNLDLHSVNAFDLPVSAKIGLLDSYFGIGFSGGVRAMIPAHIGWNGDFDLSGTLRIRMAGIRGLMTHDAPLLSPGLEIGLGGTKSLNGN